MGRITEGSRGLIMNITSIISVCIACVSLIFVAINYGTGRHDKSNSESEEIKTGLLKCDMKLDQLCATTNAIQTDIKAMQSRVNDVEKTIGIMQRDLKTAFLRIDEIKRGDYLPPELKK